MVVTRIGPLSVAKIAAVIYAIIGVIVGGFVSLAALAGAFATHEFDGGGFAALTIGVGAIVFLPLLYGGMAFLVTLLSAWLYNIVAAAVGGVEIDVR